jgi:hypothetical protein
VTLLHEYSKLKIKIKINQPMKVMYVPDPRGRKSRPTILSSTDDFPELCIFIKMISKNKNVKTAQN